jgi:hypothetical protein
VSRPDDSTPAAGQLWTAAEAELPPFLAIGPDRLRVVRADLEPSDQPLRGARTLAMRAFVADRTLGVGLCGCPASGRVHLALQTHLLTQGATVELDSDVDGWVDAIRDILARWLAGSHDHPADRIRAHAEDLRHPEVPSLLRERIPAVAFDLNPEGPAPIIEPARPRLVLSGSFRPVHDGHCDMARVASEQLGESCAFELSIQNPDKPPLDYLAISERLAAFRGRAGRLFLTNAPTFIQKARIFPGVTFALGDDTIRRLIDARYYGGDLARDDMLDEFEALETRFLIFGRVDSDGQFRLLTPADAGERRVARFLESSTAGVPEDVFRSDLSSTMVRRTMRDAPS